MMMMQIAFLAAGLSGSFSVGDRHSFGYGYTFSDAKGNQNSTDTTADDTNAIGHGISLSHGLQLMKLFLQKLV